MSVDIALQWNQALLRADMAVAAGDFVTEPGLQTAVIVSLLSDRKALPGDVLPDNNGPRGWWGDAYSPYPIGSRLWLLRRSVLTQATLNAAQDYAREALQWMIDTGVAGSVAAVATATGLNAMNLTVTISQKGGSSVFNVPWAGQASNDNGGAA